MTAKQSKSVSREVVALVTSTSSKKHEHGTFRHLVETDDLATLKLASGKGNLPKGMDVIAPVIKHNFPTATP
jgi:hypothetical protein